MIRHPKDRPEPPSADAEEGHGVAETEDTGAEVEASVAGPRRGAWKVAALFVLPYLMFMIAWAYSNPPGAAPDEADQLVKALGAGQFSIGSTYHVTLPPNTRKVLIRNASISRVMKVPADLNPEAYSCTRFRPTHTATCLPINAPKATGYVRLATPIGSYPPFLYVPIGAAALAASSPYGAFLAARTVCLGMAAILLFLGACHLVRWLGRRALLGAFVGFTPMTLFVAGSVGTSGVEIFGAFGVACVAVVAAFRRESVQDGLTMLTLAVCGAALVLSRQLGSVTFSAAILFIVTRIGLPMFWQVIKRHSWPLVSAFVVLATSLGLILWWEPNYDNPVFTGPVVSKGAVYAFDVRGFEILKEGIGQFGWLDTSLPRWVLFSWIVLAVAMVGVAVLFGRTIDRWSLVVWMVATVALTYVVYATVFYPVHAGVQGRHILPFFMLVPVLAGVVVSEWVGRIAPGVVRRLFLLAALVMPLIQLVSLYVNARRYAVGTRRTWLFLGHSLWSPRLGWVPWLALGVAAAVLLAVVVVRCAPARAAVGARTAALVER